MTDNDGALIPEWEWQDESGNDLVLIRSGPVHWSRSWLDEHGRWHSESGVIAR